MKHNKINTGKPTTQPTKQNTTNILCFFLIPSSWLLL